jgi:hypothetical protein
MREYEENRKIIEEKDMSFSTLSTGKENDSRMAANKKGSMPSQFSSKFSRLETNRSSIEEDGSETKWSKIDQLFDKLSGLHFTGLSRALVSLAKRESGSIKSVFRNYKANDKMGEFAKSHEVRQELVLLKAKKK